MTIAVQQKCKVILNPKKKQLKLSKESQFQKESLSQERPFVIYASPDVTNYDNLSQILRALKSNHTDIDSIMQYVRKNNTITSQKIKSFYYKLQLLRAKHHEGRCQRITNILNPTLDKSGAWFNRQNGYETAYKNYQKSEGTV